MFVSGWRAMQIIFSPRVVAAWDAPDLAQEPVLARALLRARGVLARASLRAQGSDLAQEPGLARASPQALGLALDLAAEQ
jgi:hypothetical protein